MTANRSELKGLFSDGKLPSGGDFAELIDSFAHLDEFNEHRMAFEKWTKRGEIQLGTENDSWRLRVGPEGNVQLRRGSGEKKAPTAADIQLDGWVSMGGRLGDANDPDTFAGAKSELALKSIPSVASDGAWHTIVSMPGHACAFEVTAAATRRVSPGKPGVKSALRWLAGARKAGDSVIHSVATATGARQKPLLTAQSNPDIVGAWRGLRRYFVALFAVLVATGVLTEPPGTSGTSPEARGDYDAVLAVVQTVRNAVDPASDSTKLGFIALLLANVVIAGRLVVRSVTLQRNGVRLKWVRDAGGVIGGDGQWSLKLRGPAIDNGSGYDKVYYHITKLWN